MHDDDFGEDKTPEKKGEVDFSTAISNANLAKLNDESINKELAYL